MDFEELYNRFFKDVYLFILAMSKNPDVAEEITQIVLYRWNRHYPADKRFPAK